MNQNIFSSLVSITKGLHRDQKSEREFKMLLGDLKLKPVAENAVFHLQFKKPLNSKKEYYQINIFNNTQDTITKFQDDFPQDATTAENKYSYTALSNKLEKYLNDIAKYINDRNITNDLADDSNYIINYLKASAIKLYAELQSQYGHYSDAHLYTVPELAEKYFYDSNFDESSIKQLDAIQPKNTNKAKPIRKPKTSFGFKSRDISILLKVLQDLQLKIDLLQNRTKVEDLHKLLSADDFKLLDYQVYFGCETTQLSYIVKQLKPFFNNFNPTSMERSGKFKTTSDTPLTANNLHKNQVHNPKGKEEIDKIIQQLQ
ncbi:DUF6617 family protein [Mariniflexile gromovii]|uniref:Uncharacterized protein n=1 Tax=Mariniflexile gromovii TaxID=362523 RepID=A0ABS4BNL8_9FLAO|nr:DUF6617 family protein [Mariniflexile gromovii]MBP0902204.1 hypothetical protein [Mariniflexile gromovii]